MATLVVNGQQYQIADSQAERLKSDLRDLTFPEGRVEVSLEDGGDDVWLLIPFMTPVSIHAWDTDDLTVDDLSSPHTAGHHH